MKLNILIKLIPIRFPNSNFHVITQPQKRIFSGKIIPPGPPCFENNFSPRIRYVCMEQNCFRVLFAELRKINTFLGKQYENHEKTCFLLSNFNLLFQRPNFINLSRVSNPPVTGVNGAPFWILKHFIQFHVEPTIFLLHLKFRPRLKFLKFGLRSLKYTLRMQHYQ